MPRLIPVAALAAAVAAIAVGTTAPAGSTAGASSEALYFGRTSQGLGVSIPVLGTQIPRDMRAYLVWKMIRTVPEGLEFHPGLFTGMSFHGGRLAWHHLERLSGGTIEVWFQAALARGGKTMTGSYRQRDSGWSPRPKDSGTIRFTAAIWASQRGTAWSGSTADTKPLQASVSYRLVPGHTIFNGVREKEPRYSIRVAPTTRPLTCRTSDGTPTRITGTLPALTVELVGSDDLDNTFSSRGGLSGATSGSVATTGGTVKADLTVRRLAWQGNGLAATGTLCYQGTLTTELGDATCARATTSFTLRPR